MGDNNNNSSRFSRSASSAITKVISSDLVDLIGNMVIHADSIGQNMESIGENNRAFLKTGSQMIVLSLPMLSGHLKNSTVDSLRVFKGLYEFFDSRRDLIKLLSNGDPITNQMLLDMLPEAKSFILKHVDSLFGAFETHYGKLDPNQPVDCLNEGINIAVDVIQIGDKVPSLVKPEPNMDPIVNMLGIPSSSKKKNNKKNKAVELQRGLFKLPPELRARLPVVCTIHPPPENNEQEE